MAKKRTRAGAKRAATPSAKAGAATPNEGTGAKADAAIGATKQNVAAAKAKAPRGDDTEARSFWFGYEIAWAKLLVVRFVIFGLLSVDALLQISHAPRYGAGGFNVAHLPGLDALGAGRASFAIVQLVIAAALAFAALGVATRIVVPIAAALYAWIYFGSQLDSYQHHYLVSLVLLLACFVPWRRPADAAPSTPVRSWAMRLILVEIGIMYLWAAVSKMDAAWLDGRTIDQQIAGAMRTLIDDTVGMKAAARITLLVELVLAVTVWWKRAWFVALPLGVGLHAGILASGLEIGLFAVLMLGFYLLVVPDRVYAWIGEWLVRWCGRPAATLGRAIASWPGVLIMFVAGAGLALVVRLPSAVAVGLALAGMCAALVAYTRQRALAACLAGAQLFAMIVWLVVDRGSTMAVDYYRFWGGNARRLGDPAASEYAYRKLIEIDPAEGTGHYQLGQILLGRGDETAGLAELREAQRLEPGRARAYLAEARWLKTKGRADEALAKAKEATYAQPNHPEAQQFLQSLTNTQPAAPGDAPDKDDD